MKEPDEKLTRELVQRAQAGDREALDELFGYYWPQVLQAVRRKLGVKLRRFEDSFDVVQGTLEEALRVFPSFEWQGEASFKYWLYKLAHNRLRKDAHFYSAQKRGGGKLPDFLKIGGVAGEGARPKDSMTSSRLAQMNERKMRVRRALEKLAPEQREILEMREYLGLSHVEIGEALDLDPDAARMRVVRAKESLVKAIMEVKKEEQPP
jgi:RNA polymerase sigma-70 factor (ECF subfamily)